MRIACQWDRHSLDGMAPGKRPNPWNHSSVHLHSFQPLRMRQCNGCELHPLTGIVTAAGFGALYNSIAVDEAASAACEWDARVVEHPMVVVKRKDGFNPFHGHESVLAVWSTYLALGLDPCETGILLTDNIYDSPSRGPIRELLRAAFAPVHGVEVALSTAAQPSPTCYRKLIIAIDPIDNFDIPYYRVDYPKSGSKCGGDARSHHPSQPRLHTLSFTPHPFTPTPSHPPLHRCGVSPWLTAYSRYILTSLALADSALPSRTVPHITLLARAPYLREQLMGAFPTWRVMTNRNDLVLALANLCNPQAYPRDHPPTSLPPPPTGTGAGGGGRGWPIHQRRLGERNSARRGRWATSRGYNASSARDDGGGGTRRCTHSLGVDMAKLPIRSQIALASATDVLVGVHGAPFTFLMYMPPHGKVLEVRTRTDYHYLNLASYLGLQCAASPTLPQSTAKGPRPDPRSPRHRLRRSALAQPPNLTLPSLSWHSLHTLTRSGSVCRMCLHTLPRSGLACTRMQVRGSGAGHRSQDARLRSQRARGHQSRRRRRRRHHTAPAPWPAATLPNAARHAAPRALATAEERLHADQTTARRPCALAAAHQARRG
jgi:hypothetical protein